MTFRNRSPKGIFGQNMSDLPNGPLTGVTRSYQSATLSHFASQCMAKANVKVVGTESDEYCLTLESMDES